MEKRLGEIEEARKMRVKYEEMKGERHPKHLNESRRRASNPSPHSIWIQDLEVTRKAKQQMTFHLEY